MFAGFLVNEFPIIYISIKSDDFSDENLTYYQNSFVNVLLRAKNEKQKIIILLDLFQCDHSTFNMDNLMKQANFYKSIMKYCALYVQHVYILSNRTDLHFFVKIFRTFGKSDVPYKIVKNTEKIEQNIYKKYNTKVELNNFKNENIDNESLLINYIYNNCVNDIEIDNTQSLEDIEKEMNNIDEENCIA
jgi:hypothetical protein